VSPRTKLVLIAALFAAPILASVLAYRFANVGPTANYGELLLPPTPAPAPAYDTPGGGRFAFGELAGRWILVVSDPGDCAAACRAKLTMVRQVRLALGRDASRVERVLVLGERRPVVPDLQEFEGTKVAIDPGAAPGPTHDPGHIYLVDPRGNVMMRWPAAADAGRMLGDLKRLLKASQIG